MTSAEDLVQEAGNYATLTYGIGFERHRLGWLEWMVAQLQ
jgi:hypothetical protein